MKVAVLLDIHGNGVALKYAIRDFKKLGISKIVILGDVVMKGPMPSEVLKLLDDEELEVLAWIKMHCLDEKIEYNIANEPLQKEAH
ncbi:metallophosphoesterase family protein [Clostridium beijerinckii]|uniref:Phosphodiesterase n=1 Tax=Clostridium beijerinckii TaxID=1520 RepID=A0A0B5QF87_CLOBE|nr:hypothetical protein [Clostridium beijerinckii]AJH00980.1 hypothetical protein LF65_04440 [Clostridium beijerinckii]AQS06761.1 hypothetical protein CLBIJ_42080 [Clostridium beijerinckii]MBA2887622.1 putative phosphodiesterase [Clostridium beijerinckii]MBA2901586.1 putative phosphodiesterase [Clostridium beijerinckii]MBA2911527.1 putative phosphodiesterase [Clostridium beijerinckii]